LARLSGENSHDLPSNKSRAKCLSRGDVLVLGLTARDLAEIGDFPNVSRGISSLAVVRSPDTQQALALLHADWESSQSFHP